MSLDFIRQTARKLGIGRRLQRLRTYFAVSPLLRLQIMLAQRRYLGAVFEMPAIPCGEGPLEVHMLLHSRRFREGAWACYSLLRHTGPGTRLVIHDDGSLQPWQLGRLRSLFPGFVHISRERADREVGQALEERGLVKCASLRRGLVFALKLFDAVFYAKNERIIIMDSDVLFFTRPEALLRGGCCYSPDNNDQCYCLSTAKMRALLGMEPVYRFNPGVFAVSPGKIDWQQHEAWLGEEGFGVVKGRPSYFAELTLWAMEVSLQGGVPLTPGYEICAPDPSQPGVVFGHYCGGGYWASRLYTHAIPWVYQVLTHSAERVSPHGVFPRAESQPPAA
ncbi:MAG: hypothetical protein LDL31_07135 [Prosthecobacter sp.]|nr:hypothetical protein [Prosthecobacter sp.]